MPAGLRARCEHLTPVAALGFDADRSTTSTEPAGASATATWIARLSPAAHCTGNAGALMPRARPRGTDCGATSGARRSRRSRPSSQLPRKAAYRRRSCWSLAEGEGFEPSRELMTPYSLSRRAPSATRSALRAGVYERHLRSERLLSELWSRPRHSPASRRCSSERRGRVPRPGVSARRGRGCATCRPRRVATTRRRGRLRELPNVGDTTATVIAKPSPARLRPTSRSSSKTSPKPGSDAGRRFRAAARAATFTCTPTGPTVATRSARWREGARHRPRILCAHRPLAPPEDRARSVARTATEQLDVVAELNEELAPFRILSGIEVDINEDGTLDQRRAARRSTSSSRACTRSCAWSPRSA